MGFLLQALDRLLPDPLPSLVFEIGDGVVLGARRSGRSIRARAERRLGVPDSGEPSADSVEGLEEAVKAVLDEIRPLASSVAAALLPDAQTRLALFEFDRLPRKPGELREAVERRFRHSLPFDARDSRVAFRPQHGSDPPSVLAAAASGPYVRRCEEALARSGLVPGFVGAASASALNLVEDEGTTLVLKLAETSMTMAAVENGTVRLVRRIALPTGLEMRADRVIPEILADLFPTLAYMEENLGTAATCLRVAGRGELQGPALHALPAELDLPVLPLCTGGHAGSPCDAGLVGYVHG